MRRLKESTEGGVQGWKDYSKATSQYGTDGRCRDDTTRLDVFSVDSKLKCPLLVASEMSGLVFALVMYLSSRSSCGNVGKSRCF